ncbi:SDR family NAD(P)-dependent oxidoreductase, partial [Nonomuraea sp. NPDC004297]
AEVDLLVEVGPGRVLSRLAAELTSVPAVAMDTDSESLAGLLGVVGAAHVAGVPVAGEELFHGRLIKPLEIGARFTFFASPAEQAPQVRVKDVAAPARTAESAGEPGRETAGATAGPAGESTVELLRRLAAERAELPLELVSGDSKPLDELHLSSVTVMHIIDQATQHLGVPAGQAPANVATATLRELGDALDRLATQPREQAATGVAAAAPWVHPFAVELDEQPRPRKADDRPGGEWRVFAPAGSSLAGPLRAALERETAGSGVLACLPPLCTAEDLEHALLGAQAALAAGPGTRFVLVQHDRGAAGLAKTLHLESGLRTTVVHLPDGPETPAWAAAEVAAEVSATTGFSEVHYDAGGVRRVPTLRALPARPAAVTAPLSASDVLLVTGGGKGITAECALAVASTASPDTDMASGAGAARLALLGRSDPRTDPELAANLRRMVESGFTVHYVRTDVTDPAQVRAAVAEAEQALGPVTAVLHGAGRNEPEGLAGLDMDAFRRTFAPKIDGLRNVLEAVDPDRLRLLVTLGSIIGRAGLQGEAHYATANEWLADLTREWGERHPGCRSVCTEWSVWSEVGMGERLSVVDRLSEQGITPIPVDRGVEIMRRLVTDPAAPGVVVISGRTEGIHTVRREEPELPLLRFVGTPLVRYHGVELVSEVEVNAGSDLYLADHLLDGNLLFPAVFGLEAMSQAAYAATGRTGTPVIEQARFLRPIVVPPGGSTRLRVAAAVTGADTVAVAIRSQESGFDVDHFTAVLRLDGEGVPEGPPEQSRDGLPPVALDPDTQLYGEVLFQGRRFQRLRRYHRAAAREVDADLGVVREGDWFAGFLPADLLLGDPGMRDALMHGNQVCVPDATLLPTGVERVYPAGGALAEADEVRYCAVERARDGDAYIYDIAVRTKDGEVVERWEGLRLQAVRKQGGAGPWAPPLLGTYVERTLEDLTGVRVAVVAEPGDGVESLAAERLAHGPATPDGVVSASVPGLTLCAGAPALACAIVPVTEDTDEPGALADEIAARAGESPGTAAARVRAALDCVRAAQPTQPDGALTVTRAGTDGWTLLAAGGPSGEPLTVATLATTVSGGTGAVVVAILTEGRP